MAQVRTVTPFVFLAISLRETMLSTASIVTSFIASIKTAQSQAAQFEMMNNLTDVELAERFKINREQVVPYVFNEFRT